MENKTASVAVLDIGSARAKLTVASRDSDGSSAFATSTVDRSLIAAWQEGGQTATAAALQEIRDQARDVIASHGVTMVCVVGAHVFRDEDFSSIVRDQAQTVFGCLNVLTPENEGGIFYRAVAEEQKEGDAVALDVGGGSVQLLWGSAPSEGVSYPVGTYSIERQYQINLEESLQPSSEAWAKAYADVRELLSDSGYRRAGKGTLVVGSNLMEDFFGSALAHIGRPVLRGKRVSRDDVASLAEFLGGKPYPALYEVFPQMSGFMHGADKLLIVVLAAMDALSISECVGTNLSVSKGLCSLMLSQPKLVDSLGLVTASSV